MKSSYVSYVEVEAMLDKIRNSEAWLGSCCVSSIVELEGDIELYSHLRCGICGRELYFIDRRKNGKENIGGQTLDSRREEEENPTKDGHDKQKSRKKCYTDGYGVFE